MGIFGRKVKAGSLGTAIRDAEEILLEVKSPGRSGRTGEEEMVDGKRKKWRRRVSVESFG